MENPMDEIRARLARIAEINPQVNAVTRVFEVDTEPIGPLAGVTFTVKGNIDVAGQPTTHGMKRFADNVQEHDSLVVARLRKAGATPIAHTNLPTLNVRGMHTYSELYGHTVNPWDATKTPGGSSGGDAVAVATGMVPIGIGNDSGGSLRIPALFTGVCALKPSYGRYPLRTVYGMPDPSYMLQTLTVEGPIARTVRDLRRVHEVVAGPDPIDPRTVPVPLDGPPVPKTAGFVPGAEEAAKELVDHGYEVEEVEVPHLAETLEAFHRLAATVVGDGFHQFQEFVGEDAARYTGLMLEAYPQLNLKEFFELTSRRLAIQREWALLLERYPVIVAPVSTVPSFEPDEERRGVENIVRYHEATKVCAASSFVGVPAVAVPTGLRDGFPTGVQVIGRMYREDVCLDVAELIMLG